MLVSSVRCLMLLCFSAGQDEWRTITLSGRFGVGVWGLGFEVWGSGFGLLIVAAVFRWQWHHLNIGLILTCAMFACARCGRWQSVLQVGALWLIVCPSWFVVCGLCFAVCCFLSVVCGLQCMFSALLQSCVFHVTPADVP